MRLFLRRYCLLTITALLCIAPLGCEESLANNVTRKSLDALLVDLNVAVSKNSQEELEKVIRDAKKLQASSKSHIQSKNLVLATANEKLARLKYRALSVSLYATKASLQSIATQSTKISRIRGTASSFFQAGQPTDSVDMGQQIQLIAEQNKLVQNGTVSQSTSSIAISKVKSEAARTEADALSETAKVLFQESEELGIIEGHASFKKGVQTVRKSQQVDMSAESIEIESLLLTQRLLDDAQAELDAITIIIEGVKNTSESLEKVRFVSIQNANTLNQFADELDIEVAANMATALEDAKRLLTQLNAIATEIDAAIQAVSRSGGNTRESQQTVSSWKLSLQWLLGQVEESKHFLLAEERMAVLKLIENAIETSSSTWHARGNSIQIEIDRASDGAIAAYENATNLAGNLGSNSELLLIQLEARIAVLQGKPVSETSEPEDDGSPATSNETHSDATQTAGFATPEELIATFNALPPFERADGTSPAPDLSVYFDGNNANGQKFLGLMQKITTSFSNLAIAVRTHIGADAIQQMIDKLPPSPSGMLKSNLILNTLEVQGEDNATVTDASGKSMQLQKTAQGWKILMGASLDANPQTTEFAMMMLEGLGTMAGLMEMVTDQINTGQITTLEQLEQVIENASGDMEL